MSAPFDLLRLLPKELGRRTSVTVPDRLAASRDLWQRHLVRAQHGRATPHELPAAVVHPQSLEEIGVLVELARRENFAIVPYGAGSGVCGAIECSERTLVVDLKRMRAHHITEQGTLVVQPGALGITLEDELEKKGVTVGHFPSSILCSTVGGWVAARGAGQCSGRYGKIEDMVLGAKVVLGNAEVVAARRRRSGSDLLPLLIGSEGTLGIFGELELRLHPTAEERVFEAFQLPTVTAGTTTLRRIYQAGLRPAVARLYDPLDTVLAGSTHSHAESQPSDISPLHEHRYSGVDFWLRAPRLLNAIASAAEHSVMRRTKLVLVFEGRAGETRADMQRAHALITAERGRSLGEGPARDWYRRRYAVSYKQQQMFRRGVFSDTFEVAAPWSKLDALYREVRRALGRHVLVMAHMSHAYPDGCSIYFTFLGVSRKSDGTKLHEAVWRDALAAALAAGGTLSHHHGVGRLRAPFLAEELGAGGVHALAAVKRAWDPHGLLCPGSPLGAPLAPPPHETSDSGFHHDALSGLARVPGSMSLAEAERRLDAEGRTLALSSLPELDVNTWIARGMPGSCDVYLDPVEQHLAGFAATLTNGTPLCVRPIPRRATGPDLSALFIGAGARAGRIEHAWLRAHPQNAAGARPLSFRGDRSPPVSDAEVAAFDAVLAALRKTPA
jgi:alkyldihydroxyacetonephosphate synthase